MKPKQQMHLVIAFLLGCVCLVIGLSYGTQVSAQSPSDDFSGINECTSCHGRIGRAFELTAHGLSMFASDDYPESIVADFNVGEEIRLYDFLDDENMRPFTIEDVEWVIGSGRKMQRYVTIVGDGSYQLLPAEWNTVTQGWQPLSVAMDTNVVETCATCHTTGFDPNDHQWVDSGVTCEACHGPGTAHIELADNASSRLADEEEEAIIAALVAYPQAEACETCHSQTVPNDDGIHQNNLAYSLWHKSPHNQSDAESATLSCEGCHASHGDSDLVSLNEAVEEDGCIACHDSFSTSLLAGDPIIDQVIGQPSAHYGDDFTCTSCHSPHLVNAISDDLAYSPTCLNCHTDLSITAINNFVDSTQENITTRLSNIQDALNDTSPQWVQTVVTEINSDGSAGLHNIRYVSQLLDAVEIELGLQKTVISSNTPNVTPSNPAECAECHSEIHTTWQNSYHANASLGETFQLKYAENGQPSYCMSCHASGYDVATQAYVFEGVVCSSCHMTESAEEHPPAPMPLASSSAECGRCHSGEHAPEYSEWLVSGHSDFNVDCVDCHTPHDNNLRLGDVNSTCSDCHSDAMQDEVHMGSDMTCVECHMTRHTDEGTVIHHTMQSDPSTCSECHGNIHTLKSDPTRNLSDGDHELFTSLEDQVAHLEEKADTNLQSGIVGGAVGSLVLIGFLFIAIRFGRLR